MKILNKHYDEIPPDAVNIMRPGPWGNPFPLPRGADDDARFRVIEEFDYWLMTSSSDRAVWMREHLGDLVGKDLVCCCAPKLCHGDSIRTFVQALINEREEVMPPAKRITAKKSAKKVAPRKAAPSHRAVGSPVAKKVSGAKPPKPEAEEVQPLSPGDHLSYGSTLFVKTGRVEAWPKMEAMTKVRPGETAEEALERITTFVDDNLIAIAQEIIEDAS